MKGYGRESAGSGSQHTRLWLENWSRCKWATSSTCSSTVSSASCLHQANSLFHSANTATISKPARSQLVPVLYVIRLLHLVACPQHALVNPSVIRRATGSKRNSKEHGNPMAKEASGGSLSLKSAVEDNGLKEETVHEWQAGRYFRLNVLYNVFERHQLVQYVHFINIYTCGCHKDIKQGKADHLR